MGKKKGGGGGAAAAAAAARKRGNRAEKKALRKARGREKARHSNWKENYGDFSRQLAALGLRMRDVAPDGNCMFRSISDQVTGTQDRHAEFRARVVKFMRENADDFAPFMEEDFGEYCDEMGESGTWGGNMELVAAARCLDRNITVHQLDAPRLEVTNYDNPAAPHLHLSYHNASHYMSVRRSKERDAEGAAGVVLALPGDAKAAEAAAAAADGLTHDERVVRDLTGCANMDMVREALRDNWNDVDATVEYLISVREDLGAEFSEARDSKAAALAAAAPAPADGAAAPQKKKTRKELKAEKKARARAAKLASVYEVPSGGGGGKAPASKGKGKGKGKRLQDMSNRERKAHLAAAREAETRQAKADAEAGAKEADEKVAQAAADLGTVQI